MAQVSNLASTRLLNQTIKDGQAEAQSDHQLLEKIQTLLEQTKNDGARFVQKISVLTLVLLPGTLVAVWSLILGDAIGTDTKRRDSLA